MTKRKYNKKKKIKKPDINPELEGFDIKIDSFGEIQSNYEVDELNAFLSKNLEDKKLKKMRENKDKKSNTKD